LIDNVKMTAARLLVKAMLAEDTKDDAANPSAANDKPAEDDLKEQAKHLLNEDQP
jgi:hypothetical protein